MSERDLQTIPARHGTATFVPKGSTIKIVNTSGTQVVDTWAFALPDPPASLKPGSDEEKKKTEEDAAEKEDAKKAEEEAAKKEEASKQQEKKPAPEAPNTKKNRKSKDMGLPSQEEAEAATAKGISESEQQEAQQQQQSTPQKAGWTSYLPSLRGSGKKQKQIQEASSTEDKKDPEVTDKAQQKANSRTWGSYLSAGEGFTSYLPSKGAISAFASSHQRDTSKSYAEQLADFSKTPVGAASFSAITGSGAASSLYAGYSAWNSGRREDAAMEYLSLPHTRASTSHLVPRVDDVLVSNLREPMLTFVEDTSSGKHDTLMAACDPQRYRELGVDKWEEHGSCAENLVLALKELNERAGLKGPKGIGADVTINSVPAPLNLFMNVPWAGNKGELQFSAPDGKEGDYVRFRAERDLVVIMSACPQDQTEINGEDKLPQDAHFLVETPEDDSEDDDQDVKKALEKATAPEKKKTKAAPKKLNSNSSAAKKSAPEEVPLPDENKDKDKDSKPAESKKSDTSSSSTPASKPAPKSTESKKADTPTPASKPAESKKSDTPASTPASKTAETKKDTTPSTPKPAAKPAATAASKSADSSTPAPASKSTDSSAPAAPKPKGKPKKLVDATTGEKKKPRKLESRKPQASTPPTNASSQSGTS